MLAVNQKAGVSVLTVVLVGLGSLTEVAQAQTNGSMYIAFDGQSANLTVPDMDTTEPFRMGSRLSKYEVHIAKMFEMTNVWCEQDSTRQGLIWNYKAGGGEINMGFFDVSCQRATNTASLYGLRGVEPTVIWDGETGRGFDTWDIPMLDLSGEKIDWWKGLVERFQPIR